MPAAEKGEQAQAIGRSRGGRTTKIHTLTDRFCRPMAFLLTGGQVADCVAADALRDHLVSAQILYADKGSGGGKSALLEELRRQGYPTVEEPGRRIVKKQMLNGGTALPRTDEVAFARRCIALALSDRRAAGQFQGRWVFFDRGPIDASRQLAFT